MENLFKNLLTAAFVIVIGSTLIFFYFNHLESVENEINLMGLKIEFGGRFMHVSQNFNKGMAVKQFLKIINIKIKSVLI